MDWMFCKTDRGMFSICSSTGCPPCPFFLFTVVVVCFEWKKYCQIHSAEKLYFSWQENFLFFCLKTVLAQLTVCFCVLPFVQLQDQKHLLISRWHARAVMSLHHQQGTHGKHLWSYFCRKLLFMYHNLFNSSFQS